MISILKAVKRNLEANLSVMDISVDVVRVTESTITLSDGSTTNYTLSNNEVRTYKGRPVIQKDWSEVFNNIVDNRVKWSGNFIYADGQLVGHKHRLKVVRSNTINPDEVIIGDHDVIVIGSNVISSCLIEDVRYDDVEPKEWTGTRKLEGTVTLHPVSKELSVRIYTDLGIHYYKQANLTEKMVGSEIKLTKTR
jgi:hypothetical protein